MKLTSREIREKYQQFFESKGHKRIPSASIVPENDPTVLFTTAGMQPLVPYLLGEKHPAGDKLVNVQKCIRTGDIDDVGDTTHHTFFEMLGNWSLGAYFKKEAIEYSFEFLTKELNIPLERLAFTVFAGDEDAPRDEDAASVWLDLGVSPDRISYLPKEDNWWAAGPVGPCGPDTEMFYWKDNTTPAPTKHDPTDKRWVEIWNDVFMQFMRNADGTLTPLKNQNIDTGMGLERVTAVLNGLDDNYRSDLFWPLITRIETITGKSYDESAEIKSAMRVIADHTKSAVMMIGDRNGVLPSNVDQGYVLRRLIRRAIRMAKKLGHDEPILESLVGIVFEMYGDVYPEIIENKARVIDAIVNEEKKFRETLVHGLKEFSKITGDVTGKQAFDLFATFGFPIELTLELAKEKNMSVDVATYEKEFAHHQEISRQGADQKFKGGLADHSEESTRLHTATHLLHKALKMVLGDQIQQKGSNITPERLRFDFNYDQKMTPEQIKQVEDIVNEAINAHHAVSFSEMTVDEAKEGGAIGLFEDKYGEKVKVYKMGDFSMEICGGPHVQNTGDLKSFKILKEESAAAGIRRIKAQVGANIK